MRGVGAASILSVSDIGRLQSMILDTVPYFNLRTKRKDGSLVETPVWFVTAPQGEIHHVFTNIHSGKVKRIKNFSEVDVAVCDWRGRLLGDWQPARAELVAETDAIYAAFLSKYGLIYRVFDFFSRLGGKHKERQIICVKTTY